jgi:metal-responsive CopG/Arc/MetJ family transcriptional regulator
MASIKTAVSLPEDIFAALEEAAAEAHTPRSALIATALREYLRRRESQEMLRRLNEAYEEPIEPEEKAWVRQTSRRMGERLQDEQKPEMAPTGRMVLPL